MSGCCTSCGGTGAGGQSSPGGCWDCRGTGHTHDGACDLSALAVSKAETLYPDDINPYNGLPRDDWGYTECQRKAFRTGADFGRSIHPWQVETLAWALLSAVGRAPQDAHEREFEKARKAAKDTLRAMGFEVPE